MIESTIKQLYDLQDYKDDAIAFIAQETLTLHEELIACRISKAEFFELIEDLKQTKVISDKADSIQTKIIVERLINDLCSAIGAL